MNYRPSIAWQPASLAASRAAVETVLNAINLAPLEAGTLAIVGIGASYQAALVGAADLRSRGRRAFAIHPSDLYDAKVDAADAYIALSASGRSRETVEAMQLRPQAATYSISKETDNPLAAAVTSVIAMASGADGSPNTTSYTASLQTLGLIADRIVVDDAGYEASAFWTALPALIEKTLVAIREPVARAAALLGGRSAIDCVGAGAAFGTAGEASLLVREAVRIPASPYDTLYFLHGPMESLDARTGLLVFGDGREAALAQDVAAFGCPTVLVTSRRDVASTDRLAVTTVPRTGHASADAIIQILPAQLLVADLADAAGLSDVPFRYRQTDTKFPPKAA